MMSVHKISYLTSLHMPLPFMIAFVEFPSETIHTKKKTDLAIKFDWKFKMWYISTVPLKHEIMVNTIIYIYINLTSIQPAL